MTFLTILALSNKASYVIFFANVFLLRLLSNTNIPDRLRKKNLTPSQQTVSFFPTRPARHHESDNLEGFLAH